MKYKVGDRVKIQSLDWYNENKNQLGRVNCGSKSYTIEMCFFCGKTLTIQAIGLDFYLMEEDNLGYEFTDEMFEGLAEDENNPKFKKGDCVKCSDGSIGIIATCDWSDSLNCYQYYVDYIGTLDAGYQPEKDLQLHTITTMKGSDILKGVKWRHEFKCPDGYIFKDENGNVINATKIVLEKKKKEYPKTYEECCKVLGIDALGHNVDGYKWEILAAFQNAIICRDAYWKIAGKEMGLGKPWKPDWTTHDVKYCLINSGNKIVQSCECKVKRTFAFPNKEMRDAFKENFDPDIERCKKLL